MSKRLKIMLTNDDGIAAQGLYLLASSLLHADFADLYIVAPASNQSGKGMSFSYSTPVFVEPYDFPLEVKEAWAVSGTPTDCVKIAFGELFQNTLPDFVFSGINHGTNSGRNIFYSGTVGATLESVLHGVPAIAVSQCDHISYFQADLAPQFFKRLTFYSLSDPFSFLTGFNVNCPATKNSPWKGSRLVISGDEFAFGHPKLIEKQGQRKAFTLDDFVIKTETTLSAEYQALMDHYVSVAPLFIRNSPLALFNEQEFLKHQETFQEHVYF